MDSNSLITIGLLAGAGYIAYQVFGSPAAAASGGSGGGGATGGGTPGGGTEARTSPPSPASAKTYSPSMSFQNMTGTSVSEFKAGDQFRVTISNAPPNTAVKVSSVHDGVNASAGMGTTDGDGKFSLTGTMGAGEAGSWTETWSVGDQKLPQVSFRVVAPSSAVSSYTLDPLTYQRCIAKVMVSGRAGDPDAVAACIRPASGVSGLVELTKMDVQRALAHYSLPPDAMLPFDKWSAVCSHANPQIRCVLYADLNPKPFHPLQPVTLDQYWNIVAPTFQARGVTVAASRSHGLRIWA